MLIITEGSFWVISLRISVSDTFVFHSTVLRLIFHSSLEAAQNITQWVVKTLHRCVTAGGVILFSFSGGADAFSSNLISGKAKVHGSLLRFSLLRQIEYFLTDTVKSLGLVIEKRCTY